MLIITVYLFIFYSLLICSQNCSRIFDCQKDNLYGSGVFQADFEVSITILGTLICRGVYSSTFPISFFSWGSFSKYGERGKGMKRESERKEEGKEPRGRLKREAFQMKYMDAGESFQKS